MTVENFSQVDENCETITLPWADDYHIHLRQGDLCTALCSSIAIGGVSRVLVMPNLCPPIETADQAKVYYMQLRQATENVDFLMTLYLTKGLNYEELRKAKAESHVTGVKLYPKGVTTGSDNGISEIRDFFPIFESMERLNLILHLHGESPGSSVLCAEQDFLHNVTEIHQKFPSLRIILEHVSTAEGVKTVRACGDTVAATITPHHLDLTIDDVVANSFNFCKPVAKHRSDRQALQEIVKEGHPRFFLGSDSAPHAKEKKVADCCSARIAAGIFSSPFLLAYLADTFDRLKCLHKLSDFVSKFGADFYQISRNAPVGCVKLLRKPFKIPEEIQYGDTAVVPYRAGEVLKFQIIQNQ